MEKYKEQDNQLFKDILERNYFQEFKKGNFKFELFINGLCRSNCEYCYLKKHQKDLFPIELYNKEKILNNFQLLINWYIENYFTNEISLFSGEWLTTELRTPIFEILYNSFQKVPIIYRPKCITIPDNMNFINNIEIVNEVQHFIDLFTTLNIPIFFSASIDGKYCDFGRTEQSDEFYIKTFNFLHKNHGAAHPMISSSNIKYWIQNYRWWYETAPAYIAQNLMMLEVRDETWTEESISYLLYFCNFLIDFKLKNYFNNNLNKFEKYLLIPDGHYSPEKLSFSNFNYGLDEINCSFHNAFVVRVPDLSIVLCHRLSYNNLILGHFTTEDNKITNITDGNPALLILKTHAKRSCLPHCEVCPIMGICGGFCCGNSYENYQNPLIPVKQNCDMQKAKIAFLIKKYNDIGLFDIIEKDHSLDAAYKQYLLDLRSNLITNI